MRVPAHVPPVSLTSILLGRRLANREAEGRKIGALRGRAGHGAGRAGLRVLRAGGDADGAGRRRRRRAGRGAADHLGHPAAAGWCCSCPTGRPSRPTPATAAATRWRARTWAERRAAGRGGADGGLHAQRGRRHLGRRRRAHLRRARAARLHPAAVPGRPGRHHAGEPARHQGVRAGAGRADLPVHRQPAVRPGGRRLATGAAAATRSRSCRRRRRPPARRSRCGCCCAPSPPAARR